MVVEQWGVDMLGQHVGGVLGAWGLGENKVAGLDPILHAQVGNGQMAYLPQTPPTAYSNGSRRVREDMQGEVQPEVLGKRPGAYAFRGTSADSGQFGLS